MQITGRTSEAATALRRSQEIREKLVRDHPTDARLQSELALIRDAISVVTESSDRATETMELHEKAARAKQSKSQADATTIDNQARLAFGHQVTANLLNKQGRRDQAMAVLQRGLAICEPLRAITPTTSACRCSWRRTWR